LRIAKWHVREEIYARALAMIVEAQSVLPMARFWGAGETSSSDGQHFPAGGAGEALNVVNARYGNEPGLTAYSHVSDQYAPFATQIIPATAHEAPYILDGLLQNEAGQRIKEHYADTGGFTDHVFATCYSRPAPFSASSSRRGSATSLTSASTPSTQAQHRPSSSP
jgi:TnpA family transposase